ncbi:MFS transporter [Spirochaetia bacterium]|nr:MFS transporter [Spirochaetia bacterium]
MIPAYIFSFFAFASVTPFLPLLVRDLGYSPLLVGLLLGVFEGAGIAGPFAFGYFADKSGKYRSLIILTYFLTAFSVIPLAVFIHPALSLVFISLFAFSFRGTSPLLDATATIQLGSSGDYGRIRAAGSLSFIIMALFLQWGPVLKPDTALNIALWIAMSSVAAAAATLFLPEPVAGRARLSEWKRGKEDQTKTRIWTALFIAGFLIIFLCRLAMASIYTFFPLYLTESMQWNVVGAMFALATACEVPFMFISARLIRRFGPLPLLALSAAGISLRLWMYALFPVKGVIIAAQFLHSLCFGIFHPSAVAFISRSVPPEKRAMGMSLYLSLGSGLPSLIGNVLGGTIVEYAGYKRLFGVYSLFTLAAIGIFLVIRRAAFRNLPKEAR